MLVEKNNQNDYAAKILGINFVIIKLIIKSIIMVK